MLANPAGTAVAGDPPLVLVNLAWWSHTLIHLRRHGRFGVNVLRDRRRQLVG